MQPLIINIDKFGNELTGHGSDEFPVAVYTTRISKNVLGFIDWHRHREIQFCVVTGGSVVFSVGGDTLVIDEGDGIFIPSGMLHQARNAEGTDSSYICLDFHPSLLKHGNDFIIDKKYVNPFVSSDQIEYICLKKDCGWQSEILKKIPVIRDNYDDNGDYFSVYIGILEIWRLLYSNYFSQLPQGQLSQPANRYVKLMVDYINENHSEPITLEDLGNHIGLAEASCCRIFKQSMGCTIFEYINNVRLLHSELLLLETNESITNIAQECGFSSASYYNMRFKKKTGLSPKAYRKRNMR